jgi:hypothetical protein
VQSLRLCQAASNGDHQVIAEADYWREDNAGACENKGVDPHISTGRRQRTDLGGATKSDLKGQQMSNNVYIDRGIFASL